MADLSVTLRSFVNAWQCDENDHLNVKFYVGFADDAGAQLHAMMGGRSTEPGVLLRDYVRFHREMRTADSVEVRSAPVALDNQQMTVCHEIRNADDDTVAATVLRTVSAGDVLSGKSWRAPFQKRAGQRLAEMPGLARPRTITRGAALPVVPGNPTEVPTLVEIGRGRVAPADCDAAGEMTPQAQFGRFSDGAGFLWRSLGFDRAGMRQRNQGTAVLEMFCHYELAPRVGELYRVHSGLLNHTDRVLHLVHYLFDANDTLYAYAEAVGVLFDLQQRRIAPLSEQDRERLEQRRVRF